MKLDQSTDFAQTATSQFYASPSVPARKTKVISDSTTLQSLEDQIAKIRETLLSGQQLIKRLDSNEQLQNYVQEAKQQLKVVRARNINEQNSVKSTFQQNFGSMQRELASVKSSWVAVKQKAQAEIEEQICNFKQKVKQDQTQLSKTLKTTATNIKNKANLVVQQMKETKKHRSDSISILMQQVQEVRVRFDGINESERKKRNQYEEIVLGLLDRTVEQGEKLLRRIC